MSVLIGNLQSHSFKFACFLSIIFYIYSGLCYEKTHYFRKSFFYINTYFILFCFFIYELYYPLFTAYFFIQFQHYGLMTCSVPTTSCIPFGDLYWPSNCIHGALRSLASGAKGRVDPA
jgi:hypothetical protein